MASLDEKRKTLNNQKSEILDARVIANYGDPGLDEDYHFDILSRYVVVMIESIDRVLTTDKWVRMLAVVKRPEHLWVKTEGGVTTPTTQKRSDAFSNVNTGLSSGYSVDAIPRINQPYNLGETIKIRRLPKSLVPSTDTIFQSAFVQWDNTVSSYGAWHNEGSTLSYFSNGTRSAGLRQKTILPTRVGQMVYNFSLTKYQYEALMLTANVDNAALSNSLIEIFSGNWGGDGLLYSAHGGYLFQNVSSVLLSMVEYEDVNFGNKQRVGTNECVPLIVATPNAFPTPKVRSAGTVNYTPSYNIIVTN